MEARENSNTQLSLALGPRKNTKRGPRKNTKRVLSLELSLGAQQVQGQESSDENAKKSRLSKEQAAVLEANFNDHPNPDTVMIFSSSFLDFYIIVSTGLNFVLGSYSHNVKMLLSLCHSIKKYFLSSGTKFVKLKQFDWIWDHIIRR